MKKLFLSLFVAVIAVLALASCTTVSATAIELDTTNAKLIYEIGEELDTAGVAVKVTFSDASVKDVVIGSCTVDSTAYNKDAAGVYTIKVTYGKASASYTVEVKESEQKDPEMVGLVVDASDAKTEYLVGEQLDSTGISVSVKFDNGEVAAYSGEDYEVDDSAYNKDVAGEYEIEVSLTIEEVELKGSYIVKVVAIEAPFEGTNYKWVPSDLSADGLADKDPISKDVVLADYFKLDGATIARVKEDQVTSLEVIKRSGSKISFEVTGRAFLILTVSSTGDESISAFAVVDATTRTVANDQGLTEVLGVAGTTVTYTLPAGEYSIVTPGHADKAIAGRNARILRLEIIEEAEYVDPNQGSNDQDQVEEPQVRVFDPAIIPANQVEVPHEHLDANCPCGDKAALSGKVYGNFFIMLSSVTQRVSKGETIATTSVELEKNNSGQIQFTLKYAATVTVTASSTSGSNESVIHLRDSEGNLIVATIVESETVKNDENGVTHVYKTGGSVLTYELQPGTYELTSPKDVTSILDGKEEVLKRNVRVLKIVVDEHAATGGEDSGNQEEAKTLESFTLLTNDLEIVEGKALKDGKWGELVSIKTNKEEGWSVQAHNGKVTDFEGNEVTATNRLKSEGSERYLEIDLSDYSGKVTIEVFARTGSSSDLERFIQLVSAADVELGKIVLSEDKVMKLSVTVDCGQVYKVVPSKAINFYAINFIVVNE